MGFFLTPKHTKAAVMILVAPEKNHYCGFLDLRCQDSCRSREESQKTVLPDPHAQSIHHSQLLPNSVFQNSCQVPESANSPQHYHSIPNRVPVSMRHPPPLLCYADSAVSPGGASDGSSALQRWVSAHKTSPSPGGTTEVTRDFSPEPRVAAGRASR
jgi:hypothetical protein